MGRHDRVRARRLTKNWDRHMFANLPTWTTERVELLKTHFAAGLSCRAIARAIPASPTRLARASGSRADDLAEAPADLLAIALVELVRVGLFRRLAHTDVELVGVIADQDAPALRLDAVENDLCRLRRR